MSAAGEAEHLLFSYGTLQDAPVQLATFGRRLDGVPDRLTGHAIATIRITDPAVLEASGKAEHLALVPDADAPPINGMVFRLTAAELAAADVYESGNYRRIEARLASGARAWVDVKA